ncbi:MAG: SET domain-containing protein-lysine N-methyltransferase [Flavobacteriales bacterium]|nr:SET domain-containing protein-lysine N-methyltransferase [Flavobacteriales bacterium]MCB9168336.1 SET domain-containing protein-lysine N-methyltransferase [Flavobacteriales bacterium]
MAKKIERRTSKIHGNGVFATRRIGKGNEIVEYKGRLITHDDADATYGGLDTGHTFLFTLNDKYVVDANVEGNIARWINHSCAPNCKAFTESHKSGKKKKDRVVIEALRNIRKGEELTYDYDITVDGPISAAEKKLWACRCGVPDCRGTLLKAKTKARTKSVPKGRQRKKT